MPVPYVKATMLMSPVLFMISLTVLSTVNPLYGHTSPSYRVLFTHGDNYRVSLSNDYTSLHSSLTLKPSDTLYIAKNGLAQVALTDYILDLSQGAKVLLKWMPNKQPHHVRTHIQIDYGHLQVIQNPKLQKNETLRLETPYGSIQPESAYFELHLTTSEMWVRCYQGSILIQTASETRLIGEHQPFDIAMIKKESESIEGFYRIDQSQLPWKH